MSPFSTPLSGLLFFLRWTLTLPPRLECRGAISAHYNLCLLDSSSSPASVSQVARITSVHNHALPIFVFFIETVFCHVGQAGVELTSGDPPASASQSAGIIGVEPQLPARSNFSSPRVLLVLNNIPN